MLVDGLAHWVAADVVAEAQRAVPLDVECLLDGADGTNVAAPGLIAALQGQQGQQQQQLHTATIGGRLSPVFYPFLYSLRGGVFSLEPVPQSRGTGRRYGFSPTQTVG